MAQVINKTTTKDNWIADITADLTAIFDFTKTEDNKLYVSSMTYIEPYLSGNYPCIRIGNSNGTYEFTTSGTTVYYKIVKSAAGDVAVTFAQSVLTDLISPAFIISKVRNVLTGNAGYGIFSIIAGGAIAASLSMLKCTSFILTDDTPSGSTVTKIKTTSQTASATDFQGGYIETAPYNNLTEVFAQSSVCKAVNLYAGLMLQQIYYRNCKIGGKDYYGLGFFFMLDEE